MSLNLSLSLKSSRFTKPTVLLSRWGKDSSLYRYQTTRWLRAILYSCSLGTLRRHSLSWSHLTLLICHLIRRPKVRWSIWDREWLAKRLSDLMSFTKSQKFIWIREISFSCLRIVSPSGRSHSKSSSRTRNSQIIYIMEIQVLLPGKEERDLCQILTRLRKAPLLWGNKSKKIHHLWLGGTLSQQDTSHHC